MPMLLLVLLLLLASAPPALAQEDPEDLVFGPREAVPRMPCRPGDRPESGLQGRVPPEDLLTGRAALGYTCNMEVVGRFRSPSGGTLEAFEDCAYYGLGAITGGTQVLDVSDPARPLPTTVLTTPAMQDPWESLRVNAKRKLLVAGANYNTYLDVYDVSDCREPRLLSSTDMAPAKGHEGWFAPDGMTYYMSTTGPAGATSVFPVDLSDPTRPKLLASWALETQTHGGFTTEDSRTTFICQQDAPPRDALYVVDTSDVAARVADPEPRVLARVGLQDNQWCQAALRVTYDGHPYLIQYGERSGAPDCSRSADNWATFGYPRIYDLADERHPELVATALLESALPEHCAEVAGEGAINGLGYSVHHCSVDRLYDPTILACGWFFAGMRVLDIRDPRRPVEIGYVNPGTNAVVGTGARPVVRSDRREIWFVNDTAGFSVVRFADGTWPFAGSAPCPEFDDHYFAHYNPASACATATLAGIGKPAPGGAAPARPQLVLSRVRATVGRRASGRVRIGLTASAAGRVTVTLRRGGRRLARRVVTVRPGRQHLTLRVRRGALRPGRHQLVLRPSAGPVRVLRFRIS